MASIILKNFERGLDTRKYKLAMPAGTLIKLVNGHVTPGGEIEKRKAFVALVPDLPAGTFGFQDTVSGILVFGSADLSAATFPTGISYQRLQHPAIGDGTAYDASKHAMTAVVHSCIYGRSAWVVAKFADTKVFCYYAGVLVADFTAGVILSHLNTNALISKKIVSMLAATSGYASSVQVGSTNELDIIGTPGTTYSVATTKTSAAGTLTPQIKDNGLAPINGKQAVGQFTIVAGSNGNGVNFVSGVALKNGSTVIVANLLSGSVNFQTTVYDTAIAVANNISANAGATGYYAVAASNTVSVFKIAIGSSTNGYDLVVSCNGNVCVGNCVIAFSGDSTAGIYSITANGFSIAGSAVAATFSRARYVINVATIVTALPHGLAVGSKFSAVNFGDSSYNATSATVLSVPTAYAFTYASTGAVETTTVASTFRERTATTCTITTASAHGLQIGSLVTVAAGTGGTGYGVTLAAVTAIPSTTKFSYLAASGTGTEASTADVTKTVTLPVSDTAAVISANQSTIAGQSTLAGLVTLAAATINAKTSLHGYLAYATGVQLYISKAITSSADADITVLVVPGDGLLVGDSQSSGLQVALSATAVSGAATVNHTAPDVAVSTGVVSIALAGNTQAPYHYNWLLISSLYELQIYNSLKYNYNTVKSSSDNFMTVDFPQSFATSFSVNSGSITTQTVSSSYRYVYTNTYRCEITDATGQIYYSAVVTAKVTIVKV